MNLRICLKYDGDQLFAQRLDIREHLLSRGMRWSLLKHILHIRRLLAALKHAADRPFVDGCNATNMRQNISCRPFSLFWRCAKGGVRNSSSCCQKLVVCLSQCFNKLLRCTTHCLTCQITTNASNLFFTCLLFFLGHRLCLFEWFSPSFIIDNLAQRLAFLLTFADSSGRVAERKDREDRDLLRNAQQGIDLPQVIE